MPLFYQMRRGISQKPSQLSKSPPVDLGSVTHLKRGAKPGVKHPQWNGLIYFSVPQTAMDKSPARLGDLTNDDY